MCAALVLWETEQSAAFSAREWGIFLREESELEIITDYDVGACQGQRVEPVGLETRSGLDEHLDPIARHSPRSDWPMSSASASWRWSANTAALLRLLPGSAVSGRSE